MMHIRKEHAQPTPYKPYNQDSPVTHPPLACLSNISNSPWVLKRNFKIKLKGALHILNTLQTQPPASTPYKLAIWIYAVRSSQIPHTLFYQGLLD